MTIIPLPAAADDWRGDGAFHFLIPVLAGFIALSIGDRPALMPGMVGGLMALNSNSGFLGGLAAGFLAGYVVILLRKVFAGLPKALDGLKPILLYPVVGLLVTGTIMFYLFDPFFSWINLGLIDILNNLGTGNAVILGLILGGMMSIDMGGPFNKAAYAFAIGVFTSSGNTNGAMMAAVMAGGMVPPLAIALATTFFKHKFTEQERKSGVTNYVMGLSFITEGRSRSPLRIRARADILYPRLGGCRRVDAAVEHQRPCSSRGFLLPLWPTMRFCSCWPF